MKGITMLILDMDGTLVEYPIKPFHSSWDGISQALSKDKQIRWFELRDYYVPLCKDNKMYQKWFDSQLKLLEGLPVSEAERVLFPIPYCEGVACYRNLNNGIIKGIVSSGLDLVAEKICKELRFDFFIASVIEKKNGFFTGRGEDMINGIYGKPAKVEEICEFYKIPLRQVCFVGDGFNDIPVFGKVGLSIGFNPKTEELKKEMKKTAHKIVYDHREVLKFLI